MATLPPEVARALGVSQQPTWTKYAPMWLFMGGAAFLVGGTAVGIKMRMSSYAKEDEAKTKRGVNQELRPGRLPTATITAPGVPQFSPAALAGKAIIYGTTLAVGGTALGLAIFCLANDVKRIEDVSPALLRIGTRVAGLFGIDPPAPFETDYDFEEGGSSGAAASQAELAALAASSGGAPLPPEVAGFLRRQARAQHQQAAGASAGVAMQAGPVPAAARAPAAAASQSKPASASVASSSGYLDATDAKYLSPEEARQLQAFLRAFDDEPVARPKPSR